MKYYLYNEGKKHGTEEFPVEYYFINGNHPQYVMPPHWHEEFEIIRMIDGEMSLFLDQTQFELKGGDIAIVGGGVIHRSIPKDAVYECVVFDLSMLRKKAVASVGRYINPLIYGKLSLAEPICCQDSRIYSFSAELLDTVSKKTEFYELKIHGILYSLIYEIYTAALLNKNEEKRDKKGLKTVRALLNCAIENFNDGLTLERMSEITGFNKKYICRIFKEYTSKSVTDYINDLKIDLAKHELFYTDNSITKVAYDSGFNDSGYFTKIFKRYVGVTPSEYRTSSRNDNKG